MKTSVLSRVSIFFLTMIAFCLITASPALAGTKVITARVKSSAKVNFTSFSVKTNHKNTKPTVPAPFTVTRTGKKFWRITGGTIGPGGSLPITLTNTSGTAKGWIVGGDYTNAAGNLKWVGACADPIGFAVIRGGMFGSSYLGYPIPPNEWGYFYQMWNPPDWPDTTTSAVIGIDTMTNPQNFAVILNTFETTPDSGFDLGDLEVPMAEPDGHDTYYLQHYMEEEDSTGLPGIEISWDYDTGTGMAIIDFMAGSSNGLGPGMTSPVVAYTSVLGPGFTEVPNVQSAFVGTFSCTDDNIAVPMMPTSAPQILDISFSRLNWYTSEDTLVQENSLWGRIDITYTPDTGSTIWYVNIAAAKSLSDTPAWVVQNLPLFSVDTDDTENKVEAMFWSLQDIGIDSGVYWSPIYFTVTFSCKMSIEFGAATATSVFEVHNSYQLANRKIDVAPGDSADESPDTGPFTDPGEPERIEGAGAAAVEARDRDVKGVQEGGAKCCAGSFARSIDWLNREYNLGMSKNAQQIYDDLIDSDVSKPNGDGTSARDEWIARKDKYAKEQTGNRIVTTVWDSGTLVDPVPGVTEKGGDFLEWLEKEIKTEDVEVAYYYPGNAHIVTVTGVYKKDGCVYVKYRDDEKQDSATAGDTATKHAKIYKKNGEYHFGSDSNTIYFAVSESARPPKPTINKVDDDKYELSWTEVGNYKLEVSDKADFSNIIKTIVIDSHTKEYIYEDQAGESQLYFRLVRY